MPRGSQGKSFEGLQSKGWASRYQQGYFSKGIKQRLYRSVVGLSQENKCQAASRLCRDQGYSG